MKSGKQRKAEIKTARLHRAARASASALRDARGISINAVSALQVPTGSVPCNRAALAPNNSYGIPAYEYRGYYIDQPFRCRDCGAECIWTAARQKWWYEVAKGYVYSTATRCAPCRAKERERKAIARLAMQQGLQRKRDRQALQ